MGRRLRRAAAVGVLCGPLLAPLAASQMPSPLVVLMGKHSRAFYISNTPKCFGPLCVDCWAEEVQYEVRLPW